MSITIKPARSSRDLVLVSELFSEYVEWLGIDLSFQDFQTELASLPGKYAQPAGELYLARREDDSLLGCIAVAPFGKSGTCEMKRLYVREAARGSGLGRALATAAIDFATSSGYQEMLLDTLPFMSGAIAIYKSLGFETIPPYYINPVPGALYFSKNLRPELKSEPVISARNSTGSPE